MTNPYIYEELKAQASGCFGGEAGNYTEAQFLADYPEFTGTNGASIVPQSMLTEYLANANDKVRPDMWGSDWRIAVGLFVAHLCALRLQTYATSGTVAGTAGKAQATGVVKSATMGDTSVSYDNSAVTSGIEKSGTFGQTKYGAQFVTMAQGVGIFGGFFVGR